MPFAIKASFDDQYQALTRGVGIVDCRDRAQIEIAGADRAAVMHNLCTNDIRRLAAGQGCEAFITTVQGKVLSWVFVYVGENSIITSAGHGEGEKLAAHLDKYIITEDAQVTDQTADWASVMVAGAAAPTALEQLGGASPPQVLFDHAPADWNGLEVWLRRAPLAASDCFLVACLDAEFEAVVARLQEAGATACGAEAAETVRLEAGAPAYGRDIDESNLPQEVDRDDRAISFTKGCYLGQETVARIDALGHVNRKLVGLRWPGESPPASGAELTAGDKVAGRVTSAAYSPRLGAALAMAVVRREHAEPGAKLDSESGLAEVISLPLE